MHQFSLLTTTNKQPHTPAHRDRGNISMLAIAWFGLMALASSTLVVATMVVQQRAFLQHSADVVTLAFAQRGETDAQRLAAFAGASIVKSEYSASQVTVMIRNRYGSSQASAHRLVEAFDQ